ncbi:MAG: stage VI sporulation protein F [Bacilli bacterium]|nr:stage VI sporulation protein F [Bacilli bacterium]
MFKDSLFHRIEKKTNIDKNTILQLASKLQKNNLKDEKTLREIIHDIRDMTGKEVSQEKEDKIVHAILQDEVPRDIDKMF